MYGANPILPVEFSDGSILKTHSLFYTFQGEGPFLGRPSVFIRLSGCNLACKFCDTVFDDYDELSIVSIISRVNDMIAEHGAIKEGHLVVITGGEPFRQPIGNLCEALIAQGLEVQIESNGTLYRPIPKEVKIVCSPKNVGNGYQPIRTDILGHAIAIKFIISASQPEYNGIAEVGQTACNVPVYVQPMDEYEQDKNIANAKLAMEIATKHSAILGIQAHKYWGIE